MNHRIIFCLVLILGNFLAATENCLDSKPGDVDYDCTNDIEDTRPEEESDEKIDDVVDEIPEYPDHEELDNHEDQPESPESTSTSTTEKSIQEDEEDYDYDSEEHVDSETQQDETHSDDNEETTEHTGMQNDSDEESKATTLENLSSNENHINLFYDAIKTTLTSENYTNGYRYIKHPERVECMITEMRKSKVMDKINNQTYVFNKNFEHEVKFEFKNVTTFMYDLEREIQDANFFCTHMGNSRIYILIFLAILAAVLLVVYIKRRR